MKVVLKYAHWKPVETERLPLSGMVKLKGLDSENWPFCSADLLLERRLKVRVFVTSSSLV